MIYRWQISEKYLKVPNFYPIISISKQKNAPPQAGSAFIVS
jgi:hypothetical protein